MAGQTSPSVRIVSPNEFDRGTAQTPSSGASGGDHVAIRRRNDDARRVFGLKPGVRTGIHHHAEQQTIAYVLLGVCEIRRGHRGEYAATRESR